MPLSQIETDSLSSALVAPTATALTTASGSAPSYSARAWVNFNGTGTVAIRGSGNVSSITDNSVGNYTVNFTTAMVDGNYVLTGSAQMAGIVSNLNVDINGANAMTTTSANFRLSGGNSVTDNVYDSPVVAVVVFR